jgi:hypothetical protein
VVEAGEQLIPAGVLVTVPVPAAMETVNVSLGGLKVAVTLALAVKVTLQAAVPVHPEPDHPAKVSPVPGVSVRLT